jgi:hypothetical protein
MPPRELDRAVEPLLHCDHCGRPVRETQHTRSSYAVDYYSVHGGHGEVCSFVGEDGQRGATYLKLLDPRRVTSCVQCYGEASVQAARDRSFRPEREATALRGSEG